MVRVEASWQYRQAVVNRRVQQASRKQLMRRTRSPKRHHTRAGRNPFQFARKGQMTLW